MAKREMVESHVENLLKRLTGDDGVRRDSDGDWTFGLRRAVMYVRVTGDTDPTVRVVGIAARGVQDQPEMFRVLNEVNQKIQFSRALWDDGTVFVVSECVGETLDIEELDTAMQRVASGADVFGPMFAEQFGGETPRPPEDEAPPSGSVEKAPDAPGMYL